MGGGGEEEERELFRGNRVLGKRDHTDNALET